MKIISLFFKRILFVFIVLFIAAFLNAQEFERGATLPMPEYPGLNDGGIGNMISGVDLDGDGMTEIYLVNDNGMSDVNDLVPRIYKLEKKETGWEVVWQAVAPVVKQNTWPAFGLADLDGDEKQELVWGPVNYLGDDNPNPMRILIYEVAGDGSDNLGVADGENFAPNVQWTITDVNKEEVRPTRFYFKDIDDDDTTEVIFNDRKRSGGWYFGVCSVTDVPDNGDGSEVWKVEANGKMLAEKGMPISAENKQDIAVMDNTIYLFDEEQTDRVRWTGTEWTLLTPQTSANCAGGAPFNSIQVVDLDANYEEEIIAVPYWTEYLHEGAVPGAWIYTYDEAGDSLKGTMIADLSGYLPEGARAGGSACGDIDLNGHFDYVFGSYKSRPHAAIFRLEYTGVQEEITNPEKWELTVIDSEFVSDEEGGVWNIINIANVDDDPNLEVLYTSSVPAGGLFNQGPQPIIFLENLAQIAVGPWQKKDLHWKYDGEFFSWGYGTGGIVCDKYNRIWLSRYSSTLGGIYILSSAGDSLHFIDSIHVTTPAGIDTSFTPRRGRGMKLDHTGDVIYVEDYILKIGVDELDGLDFQYAASDRQKPGVDNEGYIYTGPVAATSPIQVIDPSTFSATQEIILPKAATYSRGLEVSDDGKMIITGDLSGGIHKLYIYQTDDYINYYISDSIDTDNQGLPILNTQSVTWNKDADGNFWLSQDNSGGTDVSNNAMIMFNFNTMEYGYVYMPEKISGNGPRGAAFSSGSDTMWVSSYDSGKIFRYVKTTVNINADGSVELPSGWKLAHNYPNPFNPETTIEFTVAKAGKVSLTVYTMLGQKVETLVNRTMPMGNFKITFDGSKLASGMYIYRLQSGEISLSKTMMLLK